MEIFQHKLKNSWNNLHLCAFRVSKLKCNFDQNNNKHGENSRFGEMKRCWSSKYCSESITCTKKEKNDWQQTKKQIPTKTRIKNEILNIGLSVEKPHLRFMKHYFHLRITSIEIACSFNSILFIIIILFFFYPVIFVLFLLWSSMHIIICFASKHFIQIWVFFFSSNILYSSHRIKFWKWI